MDGRTIHGRRLRALREEALLSRAELAQELGCSVGHLKNIETAGNRLGATEATEKHQPSGLLLHTILAVISRRLGRKVGLDDVSAIKEVGDIGPHTREQAA